MRILVTVAVLLTILWVGVWIYKEYELSRDVDAWVDRAQVAADREDMTEYLTTLKGNLERHGMTSGHFALVFKTPANDMALHYRTINRILERLEEIKDIPKRETAYQVALDDIRGTLRELPNPASGWIWSHFVWWSILSVLAGWGVFVTIAVLVHESR